MKSSREKEGKYQVLGFFRKQKFIFQYTECPDLTSKYFENWALLKKMFEIKAVEFWGTHSMLTLSQELNKKN